MKQKQISPEMKHKTKEGAFFVKDKQKNINIFKKVFLLLIIVFIMMGVCGCVSTDLIYKEPIKEYLENKYGCAFEIHQASRAFSGLDGSYIYAVCESETNKGVFSVYCYPAEENDDKNVSIGGEDYVITDDYADIVFQNELEQKLKNAIDEDVFLKCQITFSNHFITDEEYDKGFETCLNDKNLYSHVTVYAVLTDVTKIDAIREKAENICLGYNAYRQYLFFAVAKSEDINDICKHYEKNFEMFDQHMEDCDLIEKVDFTLLKRDEGITLRETVKE